MPSTTRVGIERTYCKKDYCNTLCTTKGEPLFSHTTMFVAYFIV